MGLVGLLRANTLGCEPNGRRSHARRRTPESSSVRQSHMNRMPVSGCSCGPAIDPNLPAGSLQCGRTASHRTSCFASTKQPLATSHRRPSAGLRRQMAERPVETGCCRSHPAGECRPTRIPAAHRTLGQWAAWIRYPPLVHNFTDER